MGRSTLAAKRSDVIVVAGLSRIDRGHKHLLDLVAQFEANGIYSPRHPVSPSRVRGRPANTSLPL